MRSRRLTHWNLEILSQRMATYAATSVFFRILALLFSSKFVMSQEQTALWNNMQDCECNFTRFQVLTESAVGRALIDRHCKKKKNAPKGKGDWCLRALPSPKVSWHFTPVKTQLMFTGASQNKRLMAFHCAEHDSKIGGMDDVTLCSRSRRRETEWFGRGMWHVIFKEIAR